MKNKSINNIITFLKQNKLFVVSEGNYTFPNNILEQSIIEFISNGKSDLIKKHQEWTFGCWNLHDITSNNNIFYNEDPFYWIRLKKLKEFFGDTEELEELNSIIEKTVKKHNILKTYRYKRKRGFTQSLKNKCIKRDIVCVKCGSLKFLEVDHKKELIDGGDNIIDNLQLLCRSCHNKKTKLERIRRKQNERI